MATTVAFCARCTCRSCASGSRAQSSQPKAMTSGSVGRAAWNDVDDEQIAVRGLQFDAESNEIAFDLGVDVAQLVG